MATQPKSVSESKLTSLEFVAKSFKLWTILRAEFYKTLFFLYKVEIEAILYS